MINNTTERACVGQMELSLFTRSVTLAINEINYYNDYFKLISASLTQTCEKMSNFSYAHHTVIITVENPESFCESFEST